MAKPQTLNEKSVTDWLREHPEFLARHPELLRDLDLAHGTEASSLIERQVHLLREDNRALKRQLHELAGIAGQNEKLMQRLHQLTLEIMTTASTTEFIDQLCHRLARDFRAERVGLVLVHPHPALAGSDTITLAPEPLPDWLDRLMTDSRPECGRLVRSKQETLFPDQQVEIGSAALVPIPGHGVLAIAASSPERFYPDMGTLFLELLAATIKHRLDLPEQAQRKRA